MKTVYPNVFRHEDLRKDSETEQERKIEALLSAMTTEEKYSLLGGGREPEDKGKIGNAGYVPGIPRLGIPELVMYDGPAGITGIVETTGVPTPTLLGCTWDDDMAYAFGKVAASECSACSGNVLLAPQVDVIRSPHFFRNKDMKSEDSYQAARMGSAETRGVLDAGVIPTLKHFAAANLFGIKFFEFPKQYVDEQTMHEVYYRPFETALRENGSAAVMNAYNNVNGNYCSANAEMLKGVLRDQWGFKGAVMSDWGSVHSFTLDKGMDMEMPFPAFNAPKMIEKRFAWGRMTMETVDTAVRHVLYTMASVGLLSLVQLDENGQVIPDPEHTHPIEMEWRYEQAVSEGLLDQNAETAAQIVREGAVLLKNDGALPLRAGNGKTVLIGLGAKYPICGEAQERSFGRLERMRSGQEAFRDVAGMELPAYAGIDYAGEPIPAEACFRDAACTEPGLTRTWGILEEDRNLLKTRKGPGGGGDAFTGTVLKDEDGEIVDTGLSTYNAKKEQTDPEHPAGSFCRVDARVCFVCGTDEAGQPVKHYRNGANGNAFSHEESFTWKGYLKAPETGE